MKVDDVLWVGGQGGMEADLVARAGLPYASIPAAAVHGVGWRTLPGLIKTGRGFLAARRIVHQFRPDVMFFTGGYLAVPVALAGRNIPILLYVPDIEPGLALKVLAHLADHITLIASESQKYFSGEVRTTVTGHPTRRGLTSWSKERALEHFQLSEDLQTLLVFGGSKGARSINRAVLDNLSQLLDRVQIVHLSGQLDWPEVETIMTGLSTKYARRYRAFSFLHEDMGAAYAAADLVLSRSGASAIGEFPLFALPAVIVPYPHAWRYQMVNATYLARHGAAVILQDQDLKHQMVSTIQHLLEHPNECDRMRSAMHSLARPDASRRIADQIFALSRETPVPR